MSANSKIIYTTELTKSINEAWENQIKILNDLTGVGEKYIAMLGKVPSDIAKGQKELADATDKLVTAEEKLTKIEKLKIDLQEKAIKNTRQEVIDRRLLNQQNDRAAISTSTYAGAYQKLSAQVLTLAVNLKNLIATGKLASESQEEYNARLKQAQREFDLLQGKVLSADKAVGAWSRTNVRSIEGLQNMKSGVMNLVHAFGLYTGVFLAAKIAMGTIHINEELSDELAQLQINLRGTKKDADDVFESVKKLETRTSLSDLLGLATIVAKKGVVKDEIAGIVKELDNLFLILGDKIGDKEEATASIVKLISIFNTDGRVTAERVREIGSSLQYLTTHGVATGKYLIDFSERVGAFRSLTGQTLPQIMGLGAAFEQLGQRVEVASTATGQIITKLLSDAPKYAKIAGIPLKEFKKMLETNSTEALIKFAEGMRKNTRGLEQFAGSFEDVNIKGARIKGVLAELSIAGNLFREKIAAAAESYKDIGSNAEAAALKQKTFAGTLANVKKEFEILVSNKNVQDFFSDGAIFVLRFTQALLAIPTVAIIAGLSTWVAYQALLKGEIIATTVAQNWNNSATALGTVRSFAARMGLLGQAAAEAEYAASLAGSTEIMLGKIEVMNLEIAVQRTAIATLQAEAAARGQLTAATIASIAGIEAKIVALESEITATEAAIAANEELALAEAATPWGLIALTIGLAAAALYQYANATDYNRMAQERLNTARESDAKAIVEYNKLEDDRQAEKFQKIEDYNRRAVIDNKKTQEQATADIAEEKQKQVGIQIEAYYEEISTRKDAYEKNRALLNKEMDAIVIKGDTEIAQYAELKAQRALSTQDYNLWITNYLARIKALKKLDFSLGLDSGEAEKNVSGFKRSTKAAKDYQASIFEIIKQNLENAIKYNKLIMDDEKQSFDQRKRASLQLTADRMQLAQLEYDEEIRKNEFRLKDDLRIAKAERDNILNNKKATTADRIEAENEYHDKVFDINKDSENKQLISFIKFSDQKKTIQEETIQYLKDVQEKYNATVKENAISEEQLSGLRELQKLMENATGQTSESDLKQIEAMRLTVEKNTSRRSLELQIETNANKISEFKKYAQERIDAQEELGKLLDKQEQEKSSGPQQNTGIPKVLDFSTGNQIDALKDELAGKIRLYDLDSQAFQDLLKAKNALEKTYADVRLADEKVLTDKLAELNKHEFGERASFVDTLTASEKKRYSEIVLSYQQAIESNSELRKANSKQELDDFVAKTNAIKSYLNGFKSSIFDEAGFPTLFKALNDEIIGFGDNWAVTFNTIAEIAQETFNFLQKLNSDTATSDKNRVEEQSKTAIAFANGDDAAIADIQKQAEARKREIDAREAKKAKDLAEFNIAINAAQGIVAAYKDGNIIKGSIFAAIIAGIAVAQIAALNSADIPAYFDGTDYHFGGPLMMNDDPKGTKGSNYREVAVLPSGKVLKPQSKNFVANMPKGTQIFKDYKSFDSSIKFNENLSEMMSSVGVLPAIQTEYSGRDEELLSELKGIKSAISNKPDVTIMPNEDGLAPFVRLQIDKTISHNASISGYGITFKRS